MADISVTTDELEYLRKTCPYLSSSYIKYLKTFALRPSDHVVTDFQVQSDEDGGNDDAVGTLHMHTQGLWLETILYEIPLLALTSEAYFRFCDRDWTYENQKEHARDKGLELLQHGCVVSEFGTRRRRDYHTQDLVLQGLVDATKEGQQQGFPGKISGTSNVHFAKKFGIPPIGTVAHEWFMGIAAITDNAMGSSEIALRYWIGAFGKGVRVTFMSTNRDTDGSQVLGIALTDTFGTPAFLHAFRKRIPAYRANDPAAAAAAAAIAPDMNHASEKAVLSRHKTGTAAANGGHTSLDIGAASMPQSETYAQVFTGVRQDSGDPKEFVARMRKFYDGEGITQRKTIVFSDSLNTSRCIEYKRTAEEAGFAPSFGVGTFFTSTSDDIESTLR